MADSPNTTYAHFSRKLADGPNTRDTDECIVFTWRWLKHQAHTFSHESWQMAQTPGTRMHAHTYSSYGDQQMAQIPGTRMHAHIFFMWRSADGPYTRHTHILHLEVASTKYNLCLSCFLSMVYYWVRIDNCRLHVDSIYWSFLELHVDYLLILFRACYYFQCFHFFIQLLHLWFIIVFCRLWLTTKMK